MKILSGKISLYSVLILSLLLLISCYDRYPYFLQEPEFEAEALEEGGPGISLSMWTPDPECLIRYSVNDREASESYGILYDEPVILTELSHVSAVAYREGYPSGPASYYNYDPTNP